MRLVDLAKQHSLWAAAACGAALGVAIGLFLPIRASAPSRGEAFEWKLPAAESIRRFEMTQYESLKAAGFWNTQPPSREGGGKGATPWTLNAIMTRPVAQAAIGTAGTSTQKWVRPGDTLPDGATLIAVSSDAIWLEQGGCRRTMRLYAATGDVAKTVRPNEGKACADGQSGEAPRPAEPAPPRVKPAPAGPILSNEK